MSTKGTVNILLCFKLLKLIQTRTKTQRKIQHVATGWTKIEKIKQYKKKKN